MSIKLTEMSMKPTEIQNTNRSNGNGKEVQYTYVVFVSTVCPMYQGVQGTTSIYIFIYQTTFNHGGGTNVNTHTLPTIIVIVLMSERAYQLVTCM